MPNVEVLSLRLVFEMCRFADLFISCLTPVKMSFFYFEISCSVLPCSVNNITSLKDFAYCTIHDF